MIGPTPIRFPNLHQFAEKIGVEIIRHDGGPKGLYSDAHRIISTRRGLTMPEYRSTLTHELVHATYRDTKTCDWRINTRIERRADLTAAKILINPAEFEKLARIYQGNPKLIAEELEVTHHLLKVWWEERKRNEQAPSKEIREKDARHGCSTCPH